LNFRLWRHGSFFGQGDSKLTSINYQQLQTFNGKGNSHNFWSSKVNGVLRTKPPDFRHMDMGTEPPALSDFVTKLMHF